MVMAGARATCLWTDPPYRVAYEGGTAAKFPIKNDDDAGLTTLLAGAFAAINPALAAGAALYIAHPTGPLAMTFMRCFVQRTCEVVKTEEGLRFRLDDGTEHRSPSSAGKAAMSGVACNGWRFWSV
jgi:hypothetical protein